MAHVNLLLLLLLRIQSKHWKQVPKPDQNPGHYSPGSLSHSNLKLMTLISWRLKSPWAAILKRNKQTRWSQIWKLSLHWPAGMFIDVFNGSFTIINENAWRERPYFFHFGPQSSRHILFIINDSYVGIDHQWSTKDDFLFIWCWLFADPWTAAHQASLSFTNSQSLLKLTPIELVMPSNHLILCRPLLLLPSIFPSIRVFLIESVLHNRWPKYWSFSFTISPSSEYSGLISFRMDWLDPLQSKGLSRVFSNTTLQKHQFFCAQLSL